MQCIVRIRFLHFPMKHPWIPIEFKKSNVQLSALTIEIYLWCLYNVMCVLFRWSELTINMNHTNLLGIVIVVFCWNFLLLPLWNQSKWGQIYHESTLPTFDIICLFFRMLNTLLFELIWRIFMWIAWHFCSLVIRRVPTKNPPIWIFFIDLRPDWTWWMHNLF